MKTAIIIPSRMSSKRFPNKPMAKINGIPMIERVWKQGINSKIGEVYVACCEDEVFDLISSKGGKAIMTDPNLPSGTDRVFAAFNLLDNKDEYESIINLQGDEPFMPVQIINQLPMLLSIDTPISTACIKLSNKMDFNSPHEVKVVRSLSKKAMYFSRAVIPNSFSAEHKNYLKHLGIYAYTNDTLQTLSKLKPIKSTPISSSFTISSSRVIPHTLIFIMD